MTNAKKQEMNDENMRPFETDVSRLLDIVANALYSNRDVFLRELISNSADACDRLRYEALSNANLIKGSAPFNIAITPDRPESTLTIADNGIGMNQEELVENLGTIARSGTAAILDNLKSQGQEKDMSLIGQFGVGFYASFMVAKRVEVVSSKAGDNQTYHWESDGKTGFAIREATDEEQKQLPDGHGTSIKLHMKGDAFDYMIDDKIKQIVLAYSDHIEIPIYLHTDQDTEKNDEGEHEPINAASALWTRPKNEISEEQYKEFYHHIGQAFDDPLMKAHWTAEGVIEYTALLYIPTMRPWDLYDPERKSGVRLYVKRVFITDKLDSLMYPWLRFVRGIVDSQDLPLNISREMLQANPVVTKIRNGLTKKILSEIDKLAEKDESAFNTLWGQFGAVMKEGLYDAFEHREDLFKICRFYSTNDPEKQTSLAAYVERMKEGQEKIYYIAGDNAASLRNSPQLEGFKSRGLEVLLMTDTVDEFWLQQIGDFEGKTFQSVTKGNVDLSKFESEKKAPEENEEKTPESKKAMEIFMAFLQAQLAEQISYVRPSKRLTESPVCLIADEGGVDMNMEKVLRIQQKYEPGVKKILEVNPDHALIKKLAEMAGKNEEQDFMKDAALMLLDQALIIQGESLPDPTGFAKRMSAFMEKGLKT